MAWLHEETGYTFNGDAPIAGLTVREDLLLRLGRLVRNEKRQEQADAAGGPGQSSAHREARKQAKDNARQRFLNSRGVQ